MSTTITPVNQPTPFVPHSQAPAAASTASAPAPASSVIPFPSAWAGGAGIPAPGMVPAPGASMPMVGLAGCCPPGDLGRLMQCYCDVQQVMAFFSKIMVDLLNNDPNVQAAVVAAVEKSGSALPMLGVTNGTDAQPGQVGEWVYLAQQVNWAATHQVQSVTLGVLQPGDWDCWSYIITSNAMNDCSFELNPLPAGFVSNMFTIFGVYGTGTATTFTADTFPSYATRALISVPSLINFQVETNAFANAPTAGTLDIFFAARRRR